MALQGMQQSPAFTVTSATPVKLISQIALNDVQLNALAGCDVSVQANDVYIRYDGSSLSSPNGMLIKAGTVFRLTTRPDTLNCLLIATGANAIVVATALKSI